MALGPSAGKRLAAALLALLPCAPAFGDVTAGATDFSKPEEHERFAGGATTSLAPPDKNAFSHSSANMSFERELEFKVGNRLFKQLWVSAPASTQATDGLGPLFNAQSCELCHLKDGRGHPPAANLPYDDATSMLLRLSILARTEADRIALETHRRKFIPDPVYGDQLQDFAIQGYIAEGKILIEYTGLVVELADGMLVNLRKPTYAISSPGYGPLHPEIMLSPRVAPPMIGLGLLEYIDERDIAVNADPDDLDGDGISGRPNRVWSKAHDRVMLGRFGWKAGEPTLDQQIAHAFNGDIGISTPLAPSPAGDCTEAQTACLAAPHGNNPKDDNLEAPAKITDLMLFYSRNLAVPARRDVDDRDVLAGKKLFYEIGCVSCHTPKFITRKDARQPEQSYQLIWPYTDLLLHDMGEGLADHRPEGAASGREWRTPPLWGIGLTKVVSGHTQFLHDGRARSLLEAILWHGGEAEAARQGVIRMSTTARAKLLRFLNSL